MCKTHYFWLLFFLIPFGLSLPVHCYFASSKEDCTNATVVFYVQQPTNTHVWLTTDGNLSKVCCEYIGNVSLKSSCNSSEGESALFFVYNPDSVFGSHISDPKYYDYNILCARSVFGRLQCDIFKNTTCPSGYGKLGGMYQEINSHYEAPGYNYSNYSICCMVEDSYPPNVSVKIHPTPGVSNSIINFTISCYDLGSGCNITLLNQTMSSETCELLGDGNKTCSFSTPNCTAANYTYRVYSQDIAGNNVSLQGEFSVKKASGCSCTSDDECYSNVCLDGVCVVPDLEIISVEAPSVQLVNETKSIFVSVLSTNYSGNASIGLFEFSGWNDSFPEGHLISSKKIVLTPGNSAETSFNFTPPVSRNYTLFLMADFDDVIHESDESNNYVLFNTRVVDGYYNLNVSLIEYPAEPQVNTQYYLKVRIGEENYSKYSDKVLVKFTDNEYVVYSDVVNISSSFSWTDVLLSWIPSSLGLHELSIGVLPFIQCNESCPNIVETDETDNVYNISLDVYVQMGAYYCDDHFDCPANYYCEGGLCVPLNPCNTSQDCAPGFYCNNGVCDYCLDCEAVACTVIYPECNLTCNKSFDCAKGYVCSPSGICILSGGAVTSTSVPEFSAFLIPFILAFFIFAGFRYISSGET